MSAPVWSLASHAAQGPFQPFRFCFLSPPSPRSRYFHLSLLLGTVCVYELFSVSGTLPTTGRGWSFCRSAGSVAQRFNAYSATLGVASGGASAWLSTVGSGTSAGFSYTFLPAWDLTATGERRGWLGWLLILRLSLGPSYFFHFFGQCQKGFCFPRSRRPLDPRLS